MILYTGNNESYVKWAWLDENGNFFTGNKYGEVQHERVIDFETGLLSQDRQVIHRNLISVGWIERPLTSRVPWFQCAECNEISYQDYLCQLCRKS